MCRWVAYLGEPIYLEDVLVKPSRSLLRQARFAEENYVSNHPVIPDGPFPSNDDGFGMAWYGAREFPGHYRDLRPAWNDRNFLSIASQIKSGLFLAHIRAAYQGLVQRTNCHPFCYKNLSFQHNGELNSFATLKREIALEIREDLFSLIEGNTDTEYFFYLAITYGLEKNPKEAIEKSICFIENLREKYNVEEPLNLTASISNGKSIFATRYSSFGKEKTLYINKDEHSLVDEKRDLILPKGAKLIVSEPLSRIRSNWESVDGHSFIELTKNDLKVGSINL